MSLACLVLAFVLHLSTSRVWRVGNLCKLYHTLLRPVMSYVNGLLLPQAEDIDIGASNLASCTSNERVLIEECRNLLSKANGMQVSFISCKKIY